MALETFDLETLLALGVGLLMVLVLLMIALYIYGALAWSTIGRKLNYKYPWLAWIPFANGAMILEMGGFHWAWIFLILVPILGWIPLIVMLFISMWRIFEQRGYPGWLILLSLIPVGALIIVVVIGFVAWQDRLPSTGASVQPPKGPEPISPR